MSQQDRGRLGRAVLIVLVIAVALAIPSALVTSQLATFGGGGSALKGWGTAALIGLAAAAIGVGAVSFGHARSGPNLRVAIFAMAMVTFFLLVLVWQIASTTAQHGAG